MPLDSAIVLPPGQRVTDQNGRPVAGAKLKFFDAGTSNPLTVYSNPDLTNVLGTVVHCDVGGYPVSTQGSSTKVQIYVGAARYKVTITTADDATIASHDPVLGALDLQSLQADFARAIEPVVSVTSSRSITSTDYGRLVNADPSSGQVTLTLPAASTAGDGTRLRFRHVGSTGTVSIRAAGIDLIDGPQGSSSSYQLTSRGNEVQLISTGAGWIALALVIPDGSITAAQLASSISGAFVQTGSIMIWPVEGDLPSGYLDGIGQAVSRTTYAELFAVYGTRYGDGDGSTTFNLPDYRGYFLRGHSGDSSVDPDKVSRTDRGDGQTGNIVGTKQSAAIGSHLHAATGISVAVNTGGAHSHTKGTIAVNIGSSTVDFTLPYGGGIVGISSAGAITAASATTDTVSNVGNHDHTATVSGSTSTDSGHTHSATVSGNTAANTGASAETRAVNISIRVIIFAGISAATGSSAVLNTMLHGDGPPNPELGNDGDFYWDITSYRVYGPKTSGAWDSGQRSLIKWRGAWQSGADYTLQDVVGYLDSAYIAIQDHSSDSSTAPSVGEDWELVWELMVRGESITGPTGPNLGQDFSFDDSTSDENPGSGLWRLNHATPASATFIYISKLDRNLANVGAVIGEWDASTSATKGALKIVSTEDRSIQLDCFVTGSLTDATTYWKVPIGSVVSSGSFSFGEFCGLLFSRTGDAGGVASLNPASGGLVGINATANSTTRLVVASPSSSFTHDGSGGHLAYFNKATSSDTAAVRFQSNVSGRADIGLLGNDDLTFKVSPDGTNWFDGIVIDKDTGEVTFPNTTIGGGAIEELLIVDEKAAGTDGGTFTSGAWRTRDLNTVRYNTISGASLASNRITLPAGTYDVDAEAPCIWVDGSTAALYTQAGTLLVLGAVGYNGFNSSGIINNTRDRVVGRFTLAATTAVELRHRCLTTRASNGFGVRDYIGVGVNTVFSTVKIRRGA